MYGYLKSNNLHLNITALPVWSTKLAVKSNCLKSNVEIYL
ncbi:MAG: hypothetical protein PWP51_2849, partial [Clostridiales bacterium]|nr:hypothetical protein [Clostridiales bacterium]